MRVVVSYPASWSEDEALVKNNVVSYNTYMLKNDQTLALHDRIGDPNYFLPDESCEVLAEVGALLRTPLMDGARQAQLHDGTLLWEYAWNPEVTEWVPLLTDQQLADLAWSLRYHLRFAHISVLDETPTTSETPLDSEESEEYDDNPETDESE